MTGAYRRAIQIRAADGQAVAEMEDDYHHFVVTVRHADGRVTDARGQAVRYPWSQCPMASAALAELRGLAIGAHPTAIYGHLDPLGQCTHMLEMAGLACAQIARGRGARRYDVTVTDPVAGRVDAELLCDEAPLALWTLQDGVITAPAERRGQEPVAFRSRALGDLPPDEAEVLLILRRAIGLAAARGLDVDRFPTAAAMGRPPACFVFRPGVAEHAARRYGSVRDFSTGAGPLAAPALGETP
jgi:hypothetical protein